MNNQELRKNKKSDRKNTLVFKVNKNKKPSTKTSSQSQEENEEYSIAGSTKTDKE